MSDYLVNGYELNGSLAFDIIITEIVHSVGRFGEIYETYVKCVQHGVDSDEEINECVLTISEDIETEDLARLLSLGVGDEITICSYTLKDRVMTYLPHLLDLPPEVNTVNCKCCNHPLVHSLTGLCCSNHRCKDRIKSRVIYYLGSADVPLDTEQLLDIVYCIDGTPNWSSYIFTEIIAPCDYDSNRLEKGLYGRSLKYMIDYTKTMSLWLYNYREIPPYRDRLARAILNMSIPELTPNDLDIIFDEAIAENRERTVMLKIAEYIKYLNRPDYDVYLKELADLDVRLHYVHNPE